jgi:hypothetical protein
MSTQDAIRQALRELAAFPIDEPSIAESRIERIESVLRAALAADEARETVAWQWRRKGDPWTLNKTFNSEVFATTPNSEVRPLYACPPAPAAQA